MKRFLVTTALEETWPTGDTPLLLLGEWCRLYGRESALEGRDYSVARYHWDDREKLYQDYRYLESLYEELLNSLAFSLNSIHNTNHSNRYWRIIVGPWLGYFIQMVYDRWSMLSVVLKHEDIHPVRVLKIDPGCYVPNDMDTFLSLFITDYWNEHIYTQILEWMGVALETVSPKGQLVDMDCNGSVRVVAARLNKKFLGWFAAKASRYSCRQNDFFLISSYLGRVNDILLQLKLGQLPSFWRPEAPPRKEFNLSSRKWILRADRHTDEFAALARYLIPLHIPIAYLEGYGELVCLTKSLPWPESPKAIFTSNSYSSDDVFKTWAAQKVESNVPLVIGQHGGNHGMALWCFSEDHEISISDKYFTWGWDRPGSERVIPVGNIKGFGSRVERDRTGVALLVEVAYPRQSYHLYSAPVSTGQWLDYFSDQCRFVETLDEGIRDHLMVRLYSQDYNLSQRVRWNDRFPEVRLDNGALTIYKLMKKSRIYISTYNATTYLESLSLNFPTLIFWDPRYWELRDGTSLYFEKLKSVGIFHDTPEGAALQLNAIWSHIDEWWQSKEVQVARQEFCERYARILKRPVDVMASLLREIAKS